MNEQPQIMPHQPPKERTRREAFEPPEGTQWGRLSPRYRRHRRLVALVVALVVGPVGALLAAQTGGWIGAVVWGAVTLLGFGLAWLVAEQAFRSWGFLERPDDLVVTSGVFTRRLVIVPYERMQFVDVTSGTLEQILGLATVRLHTAAATTDARVPGLPVEEADRLRDRLAARGDQGTGTGL